MADRGSSAKVPLLVEKTFLQAIEQTGLPRKDVNLKSIHDNNRIMFGEKGSDIRRALQEYHGNLKRRSVRSYAALLDKLHVKHGEATQRLLQTEGRCPSPPCETGSMASASAVDLGKEMSKMKIDNTKKENSPDLLSVSSFSSSLAPELNLPTLPEVSSPPKKIKSPKKTTMSTQENTPLSTIHINNTPFSPPTIKPKSLNPTPTFGSPDHSILTSESSLQSYVGSSIHPWTVNVDIQYPERNLIFDIVHVKRFEYGGWAREGLDIRTEIGLNDKKFWSAWMDDSLGEDYKDRVIMVRGRARSSSYDQVEAYHRNKSNTDLKAVHAKTKEALDSNPGRQSVYYRLILPVGFEVDNVILSGDPVEIMKETTGITYQVSSNIEAKSRFVNWRVAKKGVGHKIEAETEDDLAADFD